MTSDDRMEKKVKLIKEYESLAKNQGKVGGGYDAQLRMYTIMRQLTKL